ncbi:hypothetical protein LOTGIDRAFT_173644 [Lottia gigantea]|uniref:Uncharacterized protein n=1 Tax=Lottia gigantea TaxID=225164 RepID=V4AX53_LOTGI|nr:hypothetical protein LOTGIDRAFT_173644 [Lottia gigantea]ESO99635.1 hypothetical protein LOTGIDRAFT_173644 [Lottia gigantea]
MTDIDVKKQALAVTLTIYGKAREKAIEIAAADLNKDDGMKTLIDKLDELFQKDEKDAAYEAYSNFDNFKKTGELSKNEVFMTECFGCAVLDTACSKTVCGMKWVDNYIDSLPTKDKGKVKKKNSNKEFNFGDGVSKQSMKYVNIPVKIAGVYCNIDTEVVEADIPLLLSKESLKRANTVLDLAHDKASMFKRPVQLQFTSSVHYCIDLTDEIQGVSDETPEDIMIFEENLLEKEKI